MRISGHVLDPLIFAGMRIRSKIFLILLIISLGCNKDEDSPGLLEVVQAFAGATQIALDGAVTENIPTDRSLTVVFSAAVDQNTAANAIALKNDDGVAAGIDVSFTSQGKAVVIHPAGLLLPNSIYFIELTSQLRGVNGENFPGRTIEFKTAEGQLSIVSIQFDDRDILNVQTPVSIPVTPTFDITFSAPLDAASIDPGDFKIAGFESVNVTVALSDDGKTVTILPESKLSDLREYTIEISDEIEGINAESFAPFAKSFYTAPDPVPDFFEIRRLSDPRFGGGLAADQEYPGDGFTLLVGGDGRLSG